MKNYQKLLGRSSLLALKSSLLFLCCIFFTATFAQTDATGFNEEKERQQAIENGVHADELEGYILSRKRYLKAQYNFKVNGGAVKKTTPDKAKNFIRKSGTSGCVGDFENGTVSPWIAEVAAYNGISDVVNNITSYSVGLDTNRHKIMTGGNDPIITVETIPTVHSGNYSLRLGNSSTGSQTERVSRDVTVQTGCLSFWYALVYDDPSNFHPYNNRALFMFRVKDSVGNVLDSFVRDATNDSSFFSFQSGGSDNYYRNWTKHTVDLSNYIGQTVEIEFTTADCDWSGHYGYAYIDDVCFENCCSSCEDLLRNPGTMSTYPVLSRDTSTDSTCCFKFNGIFDPDIFACDPYGVKVYKDGDTSTVYSSYFSDSGLVYEKTLYDASVLNFCLNKNSFTSAIKVRIAFYNENGYVICDTITQIIEPCCSNCEEVLRTPNFFETLKVISYTNSTDSSCCYKFNGIFDVDIFACDPYGVKVYKDGDTNTVYSSYSSDSGLVYQKPLFNTSVLDFCINRSSFTAPIKIRVALYNKNGEVICDTITQTLEPCHSSSSGCNCDNLFKHPSFAQAPIVSRDTSLGTEYECCFRVNPYTDEDKLNCPFYGLRIYKDSTAGITYLDTFSTSPMGGPGSTYPDSLNFTFCRSSSQFPMSIRVEYLDSTGKVICSKLEEIDCETSCCEALTIGATKTSNDAESCCYDISGHLGSCYDGVFAELFKFNGTSWVMAGLQPTPGGFFYFDSLCQTLGDTAKYVLFLKDSSGNIICQKQIETYCKDCCKDIYTATVYVPSQPQPPFYLDRCCWDFYYYPQSIPDCDIDSWLLFDENDTVPQQFPPFTIPPGDSLGRYCTPYHQPPNPAPGTSVTIWYKLKKQLALYDSLGNLLCIKIIEDSCSRTYSSPGGGGDPGGPQGLQVNPNPFSGMFAATMQLPTAMAVEIKVLNGSGIPVFQNNYGVQPQGTFSTNINMSGLPSGVYTLSVNNGQASTQIVKQ